MLNLIKPASRPTQSIFVPFTRTHFLNDVLKTLDELEVEPNRTEIIFYVDSNEEVLYERLYNWMINHMQFNGLKLYRSNRKPPEDFVATIDEGMRDERRARICRMK